MAKTKIAEHREGCSNLFLRINDDYSKEIPDSNDGILKTVAYLETSSLPPKFDRPPDPPLPGNKPYQGFRFVLLNANKDAPINALTGLRWNGSNGAYYPPGSVRGFFLGFEFRTWFNGYNLIYQLSITYLNEAGVEMTMDDGPLWSSLRSPIPLQVLQWKPETPPSPDPPLEPPEPPGPRQSQPKLIVEKESEDGITSTTLENPFTETVRKAWFQCEDCENNCVLLIRQKTDKFQQGLCVCKDEENWELTKAQVKAELLNELPPIVQTRMQAQDLPKLKKEIEDGLKKDDNSDHITKNEAEKLIEEKVPEIADPSNYTTKFIGDDAFDKEGNLISKPLKETTKTINNITNALLRNPDFLESSELSKAVTTVVEDKIPEIKDEKEYGIHLGVLDKDGKEIKVLDLDDPEAPPQPLPIPLTNVVSNIKNTLLKDEDFIDKIWVSIQKRLSETEFKENFLNGNTIAKILATSLDDTERLNALKTKLGIAAPPTDATKLTANGYEWTISKTGSEVSSVSRVAQANDNLSTLANSGSAIVAALKVKITGKSFSVASFSQDPSTKTYSYSIDEY